MEEVQTQAAQIKAPSPPRGVRGWEADARSQEASPVNPDRHDIERHISDRRRSRGDATSTPMGTARAHLEATPPERQPGQKGGPAPGAHAPHSPASASDAQPNARQRPPPAAPPRGGRHRGGVGTPLEGTYFQAKLGNAMCVQSLDDSLNSAIHITYRISLRSSSLREPRYPSTGVVVRFVVGRKRVGLARAVGWGGARQCQASARSRTARSWQFRITTRGRTCPRAPNPRQAREAARRGHHEDDRRLLLGAGARSHGVRNGYR